MPVAAIAQRREPRRRARVVRGPRRRGALSAVALVLAALVLSPSAVATGPAPPSSINVVPSGTSEIALTWSPIGADSWNFYMGTDAGFACDADHLVATHPQPSIAPGGNTNVWLLASAASPNVFNYGAPTSGVSPLSASTTYFFRIQASAGGDPGACSSVVSGTTKTPPAAPPTPVIVYGYSRVGVGYTAVNLSWGPSPDLHGGTFAGYNVILNTDPSTSGSCYATPTSGFGMTANTTKMQDQYFNAGPITALVLAGVTYYVHVQSGVSWFGTHATLADSGDCTVPANFTLPNPSALVTPSPGDGYVDLSWTSVTDAVTYSLWHHDGYPPPNIACVLNQTCAMNSTSFTYSGSYPNSTLTFNDTGLLNDQPYYYVIVPTNASNVEGAPSNVANATPLAAPPVATADPGDGAVNLSWTMPDDTTTVSVWRATNSTPDISCVLARTCVMNSTGFAYFGTFNDTLSKLDLGVTNNVSYRYVVSGVNSAGEGAPSNVASATPQPGFAIQSGAFDPIMLVLLVMLLLLGFLVVAGLFIFAQGVINGGIK